MDKRSNALNTEIEIITGLQLHEGSDPLPQLSIFINDLITNDFDKLLNLLYRIDVNENKIRKVLSENTGEDAGKIIAALIIERQISKIRSRSEHKNSGEIDSEEKW